MKRFTHGQSSCQRVVLRASRPGIGIQVVQQSISPKKETGHPQSSSFLVDLSLVQVLDDVGSVEETAAGGVGTAKVLPTLLDIVAGQAALSNAAKCASAYTSCQKWYPVDGLESELTVVATGDTAARLAVGRRAGVLLQVGFGHTAGTVGSRPVAILGCHEGGKAKDEGSQGELHGGERELVEVLKD